MGISAQQVKELRDLTGAGMMDCKKALVETDGDLDAAVEYLQKKGIAAAAKKADRVAAEGLVDSWLSEDASQGVVVEVNCETDFVSRNDQFQEFVSTITETIGASDASTLEEALALEVDGETIESLTKETISTIGENIQLRRFDRFVESEGIVATYIHAGSQIGVLVDVRVEGEATDEVSEFARDVAMHVAAMNPGYLRTEDIDPDAAAKQEEIFAAQIAEEGKPEHIVPRIVEGKMGKWKREQSLLEQPFVKDSDVTVGEHQDRVGGVQIARFVRYEVGEGIEKEEADLGAEVAAQLEGN